MEAKSSLLLSSVRRLGREQEREGSMQCDIFTITDVQAEYLVQQTCSRPRLIYQFLKPVIIAGADRVLCLCLFLPVFLKTTGVLFLSLTVNDHLNVPLVAYSLWQSLEMETLQFDCIANYRKMQEQVWCVQGPPAGCEQITLTTKVEL